MHIVQSATMFPLTTLFRCRDDPVMQGVVWELRNMDVANPVSRALLRTLRFLSAEDVRRDAARLRLPARFRSE